MLSTLLSQQGAVAMTASSAADAITRLLEDRFDVVVADIGMPGEDGYEFIGRVRRLAARPCATIPAIALTGYSRTLDAERALETGFDMHLTKPVELRHLVSAIGGIVRRRGARAPRAAHDRP